MARKWKFRGPSMSSSSGNWLSSHLNGIPSLKMVTLSVKNHNNTDCCLLHVCWGFGASWICSQGPWHESYCLKNSSAMPSRCSSSETTQKIVSGTWILHFNNALCPVALSVSVVGPAVVSHQPYQIWPPMTSSCFPGWRSPWKGEYFMKSQRSNWIQHGSCRSTTDTMNSGRICWNFCIQPGGSYSGQNNSGCLENAVVFLK